MTTISRICRKCGKDTPFDQLQKNKNCKDGVDALCKACGKALAKAWVQANPERSRAIKDAYKKRDPARTKRKSSEDYFKHRETRLKRHREHYQEAKPSILASCKRYRQSPKGREVQRVARKSRKARIRGAEGSFNTADIAAQLKRQKGKCYWCGVKVDKYHIDHVIPVSRGGSNDPSNIVISCQPCNQSKSDKLPHEWHGSGGRLL